MQIRQDSNQMQSQAQDIDNILSHFENTDRRTAFRLWKLTPDGKTNLYLCAIVGITEAAFGRMMRKDTMPVVHHTALVQHGVPKNVLPLPLDKPLGRKAKAHNPIR